MTVALVETAALRVRQSPLVPALGRPERLLDRVLSGRRAHHARPGSSPRPSSRPCCPGRPGSRAWSRASPSPSATASGAGAAALWRYLGIPGLRGRRAHRRARGRSSGVGTWGGGVERLAPRRLAERDPRDVRDAAHLAPDLAGRRRRDRRRRHAAARSPARGVRLLARTRRRLARRGACPHGWRSCSAPAWSSRCSGGCGPASSSTASSPAPTRSSRRRTPPARTSTDRPDRRRSAPAHPSRSRAWEDLGYYGRSFVRGGPTVAQLEAVNGPGREGADPGLRRACRAPTPCRAGPTSCSPSSSAPAPSTARCSSSRRPPAWASSTAAAPTRSSTSGTATPPSPGVQYSYLPSWISLLADQEAVVDTSRTVFETVRAVLGDAPRRRATRALPLRPLPRVDGRRERAHLGQHRQRAGRRRADGRPAVRQRHAPPARGGPGRRLPGIPAGLRGGAHRALHRRAGSASSRSPGRGGRPGSPTSSTPRTPSCSSPATSPSTARQWLADGQRGPDVSPTMGWVPLVTMWQVLLDMPGGGRRADRLRPHVLGARQPAGLGRRHPAPGLVRRPGRRSTPRSVRGRSGSPLTRLSPAARVTYVVWPVAESDPLVPRPRSRHAGRTFVLAAGRRPSVAPAVPAPSRRPSARRASLGRMQSRTCGMWWGTAIEAPDRPPWPASTPALVGWPLVHEEPGTAVLATAARRLGVHRVPAGHRLRGAGVAAGGRPAAADDAPRPAGRVTSTRRWPKRSHWGQRCGAPAAGQRPRHARPGRPPVLPLPRRRLSTSPSRPPP